MLYFGHLWSNSFWRPTVRHYNEICNLTQNTTPACSGVQSTGYNKIYAYKADPGQAYLQVFTLELLGPRQASQTVCPFKRCTECFTKNSISKQDLVSLNRPSRFTLQKATQSQRPKKIVLIACQAFCPFALSRTHVEFPW